MKYFLVDLINTDNVEKFRRILDDMVSEKSITFYAFSVHVSSPIGFTHAHLAIETKKKSFVFGSFNFEFDISNSLGTFLQYISRAHHGENLYIGY